MDRCSLEKKRCTPCRDGANPLSIEEIQPLLAELEGWVAEGAKRIEKVFHFKNFHEPLLLLNAIAFLAEAEGHHPDMELSWGRLFVRLYTHKIDGLHLNDFILAKKIDQLTNSVL
ncbi:MAG: 4a-hydroxytetrahydrobiopterin dehydratase [Chlamydiia bacterium]